MRTALGLLLTILVVASAAAAPPARDLRVGPRRVGPPTNDSAMPQRARRAPARWLLATETHSARAAQAPRSDGEGRIDLDGLTLAAPIGLAEVEPAPMIELVDGRRFAGRLAGAGGDGVRWTHARLGEQSFPLDEVASITLVAGTPASGRAPAVTLGNGDVLAGPATVVDGGLEVRAAVGELRLDWSRVARVDLRSVNDAPPAGARAVLRDGTRFPIRSARLVGEAGVFLHRPDGSAGLFETGELLALVGPGVRVAPLLASGTASKERGVEVERGGAGALVRAPATARWPLPGAPLALLGGVYLPERSERWGDVRVTVWNGGETVLTTRLTREATAASLFAPLRSETLTVSVKAGEGGEANAVARVRAWVASYDAAGAP